LKEDATPIETAVLYTDLSCKTHGLKGEYFDNMELKGSPVFARVDKQVNFKWDELSPRKNFPREKFSVRWSGILKVPKSGAYLMDVSSDDGQRLYVNDKLVIDDWKDHAETSSSAVVELIAGKEYDIILEFYDNELNAIAKLTWDLPRKDFSKVKDLASKNDAVILVLGLSPALSQEEFDRNEIELPKKQRDLIEEVAKVNKNIKI